MGIKSQKLFLSRSAMLERDLGIGGAVRPSVRPSVCLSVTSRYHVMADSQSITQFSPPGSPGTLVSENNFHTLGPSETLLTRSWNEADVGKNGKKNGGLWPKNRYISETIQDRHTSTMED